MATGNISGKVNVPTNLVKYDGVNTDTIAMHVDNWEKTISADIIKLPNDLKITCGNITYTFNGEVSAWINLNSTIEQKVEEAAAGKQDKLPVGEPNTYLYTDAQGELTWAPIDADIILDYPTAQDFPQVGDADKLYLALDAKSLYYWASNTYNELAKKADFSNYYTKAENDQLLQAKADESELSNYETKSDASQKYDNSVHLNDTQTITGEKTINAPVTVIGEPMWFKPSETSHDKNYQMRTQYDGLWVSYDYLNAKYCASYISFKGSMYGPSYDLSFPVGKSGTFALTSDVDTAKTEAINSASVQAQAKVNALASEIDGKYFKVIEPPSSTTLSDEEIELFSNGVAVRGTFLGYKNPVFFPCSVARTPGFEDWYYGVCVLHVENQASNLLANYVIVGHEKKLSIVNSGANSVDLSAQPSGKGVTVSGVNVVTIRTTESGDINIEPVRNIVLKGKAYPAYPTDQANRIYDFVLNNGNLAWNEKTEYAFQVIDPPASTTLTDVEIALFQKGVRINGTFLNLTNPMFVPQTNSTGLVFVSSGSSDYVIRSFQIGGTGVISLGSATVLFSAAVLALSGLIKLNNKYYPDYPSDTTKLYKLQQQASTGNLAWVQDFNQVTLSQADYDAMPTHDDNVFYCIPEE